MKLRIENWRQFGVKFVIEFVSADESHIKTLKRTKIIFLFFIFSYLLCLDIPDGYSGIFEKICARNVIDNEYQLIII